MILNSSSETSTIRIKNGGGKTALHLAVRSGNSATTELLLKHGARNHETDNQGRTPLHLLMVRPDLPDELRMCNLLLENDAPLDTKDHDG